MSRSLQNFLEEHEKDLIRVRKPVDLENVGALVAQANDTIVFDNIKGYPGYRLVDLLFVNRKAQARVLRCQPGDVVKRLVEVIEAGPRPLKEVNNAPCQEKTFTGAEIDLRRLPVVTHTDRDPYPYTTSFVAHKDLETGAFNQMYSRCGVLGPREMVVSYVTPPANEMLAKYRAAGQKMPQAIAIGAHPAWELAACYSHLHDRWWEAELYEAITGEPGEITRCKTVDLPVPADSSIVIEGLVDPKRMAQDGPSPGPTMLFCPGAQQMPVFEVTAITMRKDPVYRNHQMTPFTDHQEMPRLFHEAIIHERLRAMRVNVRDVHFPQGGGALAVIVQVDPTLDGQVKDALLAVLGSPWMNVKMAIAVDPDIDIYDYRDVQYALATRVDPARDLIIIPDARGIAFDPTARPILGAFPNTHETRFPAVVGKWGIDATKPVPYRQEERRNYERAWPLNWGKVRLADYLD
ncbi:MAG: UbiD family decarboxylase [Candidatus Sumerlaeota bacterium]|nr:UbiD family decarboxylase [Candidatus Sumerlaeota bacterium]